MIHLVGDGWNYFVKSSSPSSHIVSRCFSYFFFVFVFVLFIFSSTKHYARALGQLVILSASRISLQEGEYLQQYKIRR